MLPRRSCNLGTRTVNEIFSQRAALELYLRVEAALAEAQAALGIVPEYAAREIARRAKLESLDLEKLRVQTERTGYPIAPLVRQLTEVCGEHGRYVHWGATTQDILNTALALQINEAFDRLAQDLREPIGRLAVIASEHRETFMVARTFGGHALPITFGFKVAVWLSGLLRHAERLNALRRRPMEGELAGVAGTLASLGTHGLEVRRRFVQILGLPEPLITWSGMRDGVVDRVTSLAVLTGTLGKIAQDISDLGSTEIGELAEPVSGGKDASSTLPFKSNPVYCAQVMLSASLVAQYLASVLQAMRQRQERSGEGLLEFEAVPQAFVQAERCLSRFRLVIDGLRVFPERMRSNLSLTRGILLAERYMMALAPHLGRLAAHDLVHDACRQAGEHGMELAAVLTGMPEAARHLDITALSDPRTYLGGALVMTDEVLAAARGYLEQSENTRP